MPVTQYWGAAPAHQATHLSGGGDPLTGLLDANARQGVYVNGTLIATRRAVNLVAGTGVTFFATDDLPNERVNVTINAAGGSQLKTTVAEVKLGTLSTPSARTSHTIYVRARAASTGQAGVVMFWLFEGATLRAGPFSGTISSTSFATFTGALTQAEATAITAYTDLRIRFQGVANAGSNLTTDVSQAYLETPV